MKKNIKYLLIGLLVISAFTSCDNDATNGILSNIVNSELQEEYQIIAVAEKSDHTKFYSVEADGIYLTKDAINPETSVLENTRTLILDTSEYLNISSIYFDDTNVFFKSSSASESNLYYFAQLTPGAITSDNVSEIAVQGTFKELTANGYVVAKDDDYYYKKITDTGNIIKVDDTIFATPSESLSTTVVVGDEIILQTLNTDSTYNYYSTAVLIDDAYVKNQEFKIVSAVLETTTPTSSYYCVLSNASLINLNDSTYTELYENENTNYTFKNKAQSLFVTAQNLLIVFDSSNDVLLYDYTNTTVAERFKSLTEGFANILRNTSDIVGAFKDTDSKYYIATNINGYYTVEFVDLAKIVDDDSENSTCVSTLD